VVAVSITLARGLDIACGCLDADAGRKVGMKLLVEDLLLLGAAAVLVLKAGDRIGLRSMVGVGEGKR
jgi:hypothetical protein